MRLVSTCRQARTTTLSLIRKRTSAPALATTREVCEEGQDWDKKTVAGQTLSLNEIEHGVIRTPGTSRASTPASTAPRGPARSARPSYRGDDRLDDQLTAQFKLWLRDETKGLTLDDDAKKPMLSRIFLWYAGDFESRGGSPAYAAQYAPAGAARDALATMARASSASPTTGTSTPSERSVLTPTF